MSVFNSLRVARVSQETRDAVAITFDVPTGLREQYRYVQGQHLTLRCLIDGEEYRRSYSICSAVGEERLTVAVKRVAGGMVSNWVNDHVAVGTTIDVMSPSGNFHVPLSPANAKNYLGFAAGSGITPLLSIIKTTLMEEPNSSFTLFYGNRASSSVLFREQLADLKDNFLERFRLTYVMSREVQDIDLFNGRIDKEKCQALFARWIDLSEIDAAFICGPEQMMLDVSAALQEGGLTREQIKFELFASAGNHRQGARPVQSNRQSGEADVTLVVDGAQTHFKMAKEGESLLDAALRHGVDVRYSCKAGVCATCRCKVVEGKVDMDANYALEDYEIARGFVLSCQSFPVSDSLVLSFDQDH